MRARPNIFSVTSRYLIREFVAVLIPVVLAFLIIYLIVDFFDRFDILLRSHADALAAVRYFLFKIPLMLTQIMPPAVLAAMLLSLGMLSRHNELVALRASGVSLLETAFPLVVLAGSIGVGTLVWNETIVPYCTRACQYINNVEIRKRPQRGILSERGIWYHGANGFYSIDQIDPRHGTLLGLTIYQVGANFELQRIIEVASAQWTGEAWLSSGAFEHAIGNDGQVHTRAMSPDDFVITESLGDFLDVHREPEELSYIDLRQRMRELSRKGIDPSGYLVDLNMKLSVPFAALVLACVAIPLAGRVVRHPSIAATVGVGLVVGFGYWVLLALANALGQSGVLPALVSAWAANVIYILLGCGLFLSLE
ncbi:MAG: permease [Deltaproteobacteria bacterium]|nr:permease [Deltaproteobacteria bacterium]